MTKPWFVLSPCGTSLLTNSVTDEAERKAIGRCANFTKPDDCAPEDHRLLEGLIGRMKTRLTHADQSQVAKLSAELNAIIKLYDGQPNAPQHFHQLLCTDTWLGETTASAVADWLTKAGFTVDVRRQTDLRTDDLQAFQAALSDLVQWCEETVAGYAQSGYRVIFNLTGGFKSVQGFLQTLAMFYADETVYVFETGTELLRIPRLPVALNADQVVRENLRSFRHLAVGLKVEVADVEGIPETLLLKIDDELTLSPWGSLVWEQTKKQIYTEALHPSPSPKLAFGSHFESSVKGIAPDRLRHVNERLDQLARRLEEGEYNPKSLDFKPLQGNPHKGSTHECDAWADQDAKRLFGHYDGNGCYVLDRLDKGLH